jgi:hypothetical protein
MYGEMDIKTTELSPMDIKATELSSTIMTGANRPKRKQNIGDLRVVTAWSADGAQLSISRQG